MSSLIQKLHLSGTDLRAMEIYFDSSAAPIDDELFYDVIIGPFSQKIVLSKKQPKKKVAPKPPKVKREPIIKSENDASAKLPRPKKEIVTQPNPPQPPIFLHRSKNEAAVALGSLGGKKGGPARAEKLSPERRKEIAKSAAEKRWAKK